ncbi:MAG: LemA family protein [Clostridia bacterium]|nr:LemA family protein [Clostridia bacterium]
MANELDEMNYTPMDEGREVNVIAKQISPKVGLGSKIFEIMLWVLAIIPGIVFLFMKKNADNYFKRVEQHINKQASTIDNYLEQRVMVLQNCAQLVNKSIELDKDTFQTIAALRAGTHPESGEMRNEMSQQVDGLAANLRFAVERYPELKAHDSITEAMEQNLYLQREITACRDTYNDLINEWNMAIFQWPTKQIVAAKKGYTTKIPFIASKAIKEQAKGTFFD